MSARALGVPNVDIMCLEFEEFWRACRVKKDKKKAWLAYIKARRIASAEQLRSGMGAYVAETAHRSPEATKYPATWLNGECWTDDPMPEHREHRSAAESLVDGCPRAVG